MDRQAAAGLVETTDTDGRNQEIAAVGIERTEGQQGCPVKLVRIPFAFKNVHTIMARRNHKIEFPARDITPVSNRLIGLVCLQVFQNDVFPKHAAVFGTQGVPRSGAAGSRRGRRI